MRRARAGGGGRCAVGVIDLGAAGDGSSAPSASRAARRAGGERRKEAGAESLGWSARWAADTWRLRAAGGEAEAPRVTLEHAACNRVGVRVRG